MSKNLNFCLTFPPETNQSLAEARVKKINLLVLAYLTQTVYKLLLPTFTSGFEALASLMLVAKATGTRAKAR